MGERTLRRLLIMGASAVVRHVARRGVPAGSWLERMCTRKPRMLVIVALTNQLARMVWALMARGKIDRTPACRSIASMVLEQIETCLSLGGAPFHLGGAGFIMRNVSTKTKLAPSSTVSKQSSSTAGNCSSLRPGNRRAIFIVDSDRRCLA